MLLCVPCRLSTAPQCRLRLPGCESETSAADSPTQHSAATPRGRPDRAAPRRPAGFSVNLCAFGPVSALLTFSRVAPSSLAFIDGCHSIPPIRESGAAHDRTSRSHLKISSHMDWTSSLALLNIWCQIRRAERRAAMRPYARRPRFVGLDAADAAAGKPRFGEGLPDPEIEGWALIAKSCSMLALR